MQSRASNNCKSRYISLMPPRPLPPQAPRFMHRELDVAKLWRLVDGHGGYDEVVGSHTAALPDTREPAAVGKVSKPAGRFETRPRAAAAAPQVCHSKLWAQVGRHFDPPKSMTNLRCPWQTGANARGLLLPLSTHRRSCARLTKW